jgi:hypothetical protein
MAKRDVRYPHTIGFRVTDETWLRIEQEIPETDLNAHDWCRLVVTDRLDSEYGFSRKERLLFHQVVRTQFLIAQGFQVLDNKLGLNTGMTDRQVRDAMKGHILGEGTLTGSYKRK